MNRMRLPLSFVGNNTYEISHSLFHQKNIQKNNRVKRLEKKKLLGKTHRREYAN